MNAMAQAFDPIVKCIIEQMTEVLREELKGLRLQQPPVKPDRALSKKETAEKLGLTVKGLAGKVKLGTVPPPFTAPGEYPRWSERAIERYMSGEYRGEGQ